MGKLKKKKKKNGQNRELFKRTLHGKVGEAEKKRDNKNWREAWVKCSEFYEKAWTRERNSKAYGGRKCVRGSSIRRATNGKDKNDSRRNWTGEN